MSHISPTDPCFIHHIERINGIRLHFVEAGSGPLVLLCHGWPEIWYSWRYQMLALAAAGYRAVAPDMRGFGSTEAPEAVEEYAMLHVLGDMLHLLDHLKSDKAVIVGHDWGAVVAWNACLLRPDRFRAVIGMAVPYLPRSSMSFVRAIRAADADNNFVIYFQEPGIAERELEADVESTLQRFYYSASGDLPDGRHWQPSIPPGGGFLDTLSTPAGPLRWLSEDDLAVYVEAFRASGFRGGLNWYRNIERNWFLGSVLVGAAINQPAMFIAGDHDAFLDAPWTKDAIQRMARYVPHLRPPVILPGGHWINQEQADTVSKLLVKFLHELSPP
ncbi:MAG: alpha/beta fold hydrolase [Gammaproteobacteria bacterium]